jgi:hypothetical protein
LAACGAWALVELQRLCHMATAPPTGGEWRAWYARLCKLIDRARSQGSNLWQTQVMALGVSRSSSIFLWT